MGLLSKGTIELHLKKYNFNPGDEIEGTVRIKLKKPRPGKELTVSFIGQKIDRYVTTSGVIGSSSRKGADSDKKVQTIYSFKLPLAGEQEYHNNEYNFSILIPQDILDFREKSGPEMSEGMKTTMTAFTTIAGGTTHTDSKLKWMIKARLDILCLL